VRHDQLLQQIALLTSELETARAVNSKLNQRLQPWQTNPNYPKDQRSQCLHARTLRLRLRLSPRRNNNSIKSVKVTLRGVVIVGAAHDRSS
jgi:hypothetical protein